MDTFLSFKKRAGVLARAAAPYAGLLLLASTALAQSGSLDSISTVASNFTTWLRAIAGTLGVVAIVWGGINLYFTDMSRGFGKVVAGVIGLVIAGYAQSIVNTFFTTSS